MIYLSFSAVMNK